jgi:hypothetical protein
VSPVVKLNALDLLLRRSDRSVVNLWVQFKLAEYTLHAENLNIPWSRIVVSRVTRLVKMRGVKG